MKNLNTLASGGSAVAEQLTRDPWFKGLNPDYAS
jgi:hypothetical protein